MTEFDDDSDLSLEDRALLARMTGSLASDELWAEPAPGGADAFLAAVAADQRQGGGGETAGSIESAGNVVSIDDARSRSASEHRPPRRWAMVGAAAAVAFLLGLGAGFGAFSGSDGVEGEEFAIAGTDVAPDASAIATVENDDAGWAIELDVSGLGPAPEGTFYTAWVIGEPGPVPIGTFHLRNGDDGVVLWAGVKLVDYPTLAVTLQDEGGGTEPNMPVLLSGPIAS